LVVIIILGNVRTKPFYFMETIINVDVIIIDLKGYFLWFLCYISVLCGYFRKCFKKVWNSNQICAW